MRKIKVLEMVDKPFLGGGQKNLLSLARSLDKNLFEVSVCSRGNGPLVDELQSAGIAHFAVPFGKKISPKIIREIVSLLKSERFDILHTHGGVAGFFGRWAAGGCRVPVILHTLHGIHYLHYRNPLLRYVFVLLERFFSRFTDALVFVSPADRRKGRINRLAPIEKMFLIENGIDFSAYGRKETSTEARQELGIDSDLPVIGTVARLHRQKGLDYLVKAAKRIVQSYPEVKVIIVGEGPQRQKLERLIKKLGLTDTVQLLGEREDVKRFLLLCDVFVLPSLWEGLPYVLMEAGSFSLPVVASNVDGIRDMIKDGETGILVSPKDSNTLALSVIRLLEDKDRRCRLGEKLREFILPRYTQSRMIRLTQDLYLKLYKKSQTKEKRIPLDRQKG
jgi:glycosyltransferase involved in cell wall biosynthesis